MRGFSSYKLLFLFKFFIFRPMKTCFFTVFLACSVLGFVEVKAEFVEEKARIKQGKLALKRLLEKYPLSSFQVKISQEVFLAVIKTNLISKGFLSVKNQKFRLDLKGKPSSLTVFDGQFLWHQADKTERVVFKIKDPLQFQILTIFFNQKELFENFQLKEFHKKDRYELYHLQAKREMEGLEKIFIKADKFILEIRVVWKSLSNWQKYKLSQPVQKNLSAETFKFPSEGFKIVDKIF